MTERSRREVNPLRYTEEFSRLTVVKTPEIGKREKKPVRVISTCTEVDKVDNRAKIHFVGYSTQFDEWRYFKSS